MSVEPEEKVLLSLLRESLQQQNATNRDGFDRLEAAHGSLADVVKDTSAAAQRDFRIMAGVLLVGLLGTMGVDLYGKVGNAVISTAAPAAHAKEAPNGHE
jgi:hypothetical protein